MAKRFLLLFNLFFVSSTMVFALSSGLPDFTQLVENQSPSVVKISTKSTRKAVAQGREDVPELFRYFFGDQLPDDFNYNQPQPSQGLGSGFIFSDDGYILTNNHVVDGADEITVRLTNGDEFEAQLIGADAASDVAVLKIESENLPAVKLGNSDELRVGEWVLAIGSPFNFEYSVTAGIVSAKGRALGGNDRYVPFIQTDVAINPGNSGGPLFNLDGEVVGINSQIYTRSGGFMGVSFAIPINIAMSVAEQLKENGIVQRGWLGVEMYAAFNDDLELAKSLGLERAEGALVARVFSDSPAEKAGIQTNDVIIDLNGSEVKRYSDLPPLVGLIKPGDTVEAIILRDGKKRKVSVTIGILNENGLAAAPAVNPEADNPLNIIVRDAGGKNGVVVEQVLDGPAKRAGMRQNDIITMMRNEFVRTEDDFDRIMSDLPANGAVAVRIIRGNNIVYLAIPIK
jgi:serine protease Do